MEFMNKQLWQEYLNKFLKDLAEHKGSLLSLLNIEVDLQTYWDKLEDIYRDIKPQGLIPIVEGYARDLFLDISKCEDNVYLSVEKLTEYKIQPKVFLAYQFLNSVAELEVIAENVNEILDPRYIAKKISKILIDAINLIIYTNIDDITAVSNMKQEIQELELIGALSTQEETSDLKSKTDEDIKIEKIDGKNS